MMRYFKHYCTAEYSSSLSIIEEKYGFEGLGRYWRLLEFLSRNYDGESSVFHFHRAIIRQTLRLRSWNDLESFTDHLSTIPGIDIDRSKNIYKIDASILVELQSKNFKDTRSRRAKKALKIKDKDKDKDKDKKVTKVTKKVKFVEKSKTDFDKKLKFDQFYAAYPKKSGQKTAKTVFNRLIKSPNSYEDLLCALKNYSEYVCLSKTPLTFTKAPTSFIENYKDFICPQWKEQALEPLRKENSHIYKDSFNFIDVSPQVEFDLKEPADDKENKNARSMDDKTTEQNLLLDIGKNVEKVVDNWKTGVTKNNTSRKTSNRFMTKREVIMMKNKESYDRITELEKRSRNEIK